MPDSWADDISDQGHVVGSSGDHAFLWTESGGMRDLGVLSSSVVTESHAHGVNRFGQAVGYSRLRPGYRPALFPTVP